MAFGQEVSDFINAFSATRKMVRSKEEKEEDRLDREYKRARLEYLKSQGANMDARTKALNSPGDADFLLPEEGDDTDYSTGAIPVEGETAETTNGEPVAYSRDPVSRNLAPHQRAALNAIAGPESAGKYNVRYTPRGGALFQGYDRHPGIFEKGPDGPSSAAGRYQFTKTTWDGMGGGRFTPDMQDQRALQLAEQVYKAKTGRSFDADVRKYGFTRDMARVLGPTWRGLADNPDKALAAYRDSMARYTQNFASGGAVGALSGDPNDPRVAGLNQMLDEEDAEAPVQTTPQRAPRAALPEVGPADGETADLPSAVPVANEAAPDAAPDEDGEDDESDGHTAVRVGMEAAAAENGLTDRGAIPVAGQRSDAVGYLRGKGAASGELVRKAQKLVDPKGRLSESERNIRAMGKVYRFYMNRGEPEKAMRAAASMVQYHRAAANQYGALAKAAAAGGDIDGATKAIMKAYANIPDGRDLKLVQDKRTGGIAFQFTDSKTGKVMQKGILPPNQIAAMAMRVSPDNFDQYILSAAGMRAAGGGKSSTSKAPEIEKTEERYGRAGDEFDTRADQLTSDEAGEQKIDLPEPQRKEMRRAAENIYTDPDNMKNGLRAADAALVPFNIIQVDPNQKEGDGFTPTKVDEKRVAVQFENGPLVFMPGDTFARLYRIRKERIAGAEEKQAKDEAYDAKQAGTASRFLDAAKKVPGYLGDNLSRKPAYPWETSAGRGSAVPAEEDAPRSGW